MATIAQLVDDGIGDRAFVIGSDNDPHSEEDSGEFPRLVITMEWRPSYPSAYFHQEIARARHADLLREARQHQLAALLKEEHDRTPHVRVARLVGLERLALLLRGRAHAAQPADSAA